MPVVIQGAQVLIDLPQRLLLLALNTNPRRNSCFIREYGKNSGFPAFPPFSSANLPAISIEAVPKLQFWNSNLKIRSFARLKA
jgi:hypothetical protein